MLLCKKLDSRAILPTRKEGDAGYDLYALEDIVIPSLFKQVWRYVQTIIGGILYNEYNPKAVLATKVKTGIALKIPNGMVGLIKDRSSMGSKLLTVLGGVIDSGYRGDVTVCLANLSFHDYQIKVGDKVAQIVITNYYADEVKEVDELDITERGEKGFGSTGI